jgi:hypothetical protein
VKQAGWGLWRVASAEDTPPLFSARGTRPIIIFFRIYDVLLEIRQNTARSPNGQP